MFFILFQLLLCLSLFYFVFSSATNGLNLKVYLNQPGHLNQQLGDIKMSYTSGKQSFKVFTILILLLMVFHMVSTFNYKVTLNILINTLVLLKNFTSHFPRNKKVQLRNGYYKDYMKVIYPAHTIKTSNFHFSFIYHHYL